MGVVARTKRRGIAAWIGGNDMKLPRYLKMSFKEQKPEYRGTIKGGWIKIPPNKDVGLPCATWVWVAWYWRVWVFIRVISRMRITFYRERD